MSPVKLLYVVAITASLSFLGTGLASAALIGVDWGGAAPTNWNVGTAGANTQNLLNLIDETGAATGINLSYDGAVFSDTILVGFAPNASQIPTHSNSLANLGGALGDAGGINFTYSNLAPNTQYDIYLFGGNPFLNTIHNVTGSVVFNQIFSSNDSGELWVNGQVGSNAPLSSFAVTGTSSAIGQLFINVSAPSGPGVDIAGLAIEAAAVPEPTTFTLLGLALA